MLVKLRLYNRPMEKIAEGSGKSWTEAYASLSKRIATRAPGFASEHFDLADACKSVMTDHHCESVFVTSHTGMFHIERVNK